MPAVLVTGATVTQNLLFSSLTGSHCAYPWQCDFR